MLITFNIGTDMVISPHELNLLQGQRTFGIVNLQLKNYKVDYELGKIAPFFKPTSSGVRYNKISYDLPLQKVFSWLPESMKLHAEYYTEKVYKVGYLDLLKSRKLLLRSSFWCTKRKFFTSQIFGLRF